MAPLEIVSAETPEVEPDCPPVIPPVTIGIGHEKVVPTGIIPFTTSVNGIENPLSVQITDDILLILALGLTVTVTENEGLDPQLAVAGVTI